MNKDVRDEGLTQPFIENYKQEDISTPSVSHIYKLKKEQLQKLFASHKGDQPLDELREFGSTAGVIKKLASDENTGIIGDDKDIKRRSKVFGKNIKPLPTLPPFLESVKGELGNKIWWGLAGAAILSGLCGWIAVGVGALTEGISIIIAGIVMILITSGADYLKDRNFVTLQSMIKDEIIAVIRGRVGATQSVSVWDLVVGDVILIETGARVPADCLVIESTDLQVQESVSDGEEAENFRVKAAVGPDEAHNMNKDPFLRADSLITQGSCKALVCCVGQYSTRGTQEKKLDTNTDTPLQEKLENLGDQFSLYGIYSSAAILVLSLIMIMISVNAAPEGKLAADDQTTFGIVTAKLPQTFTLVICLFLVAIPEGLPMMIGVSLAFTVMKMNADKILVRKLNAPEKMGAVEEICCGKTGTITSAQMRVAQFYCEQRQVKNTRKNTILHCELSQQTLESIKGGILYNCEARVEMDATTYVPVGNPTEVGFLKFLQDADIPIHLLIQRKNGRIRAQVPFSSEKKRSAIALEDPDRPGVVVIHVKGAPEVILDLCQSMVAGERDAELGPDEKDEIDQKIRQMASQMLRIIAFATYEMDSDEWINRFETKAGSSASQEFEEQLSNGEIPLKFLGAFGLRDPIRPNVKSCVSYARDMGNLTVRMVSGDHIETAKSVAIKAGILRHDEQKKNYAVMEAEDFRAVVGGIIQKSDENTGRIVHEVENQEAFEEVAQNLRVLARASAKDKHLLVVGLQGMQKPRVVTVTGEGINDMLALEVADVGLAMGNGCSAAKEKADLILTDSDFEASLRAIMWGRNIYHNVSRFLQFQVTVNLSALVTVAFGLLIFAQSPINPVQLLWINLIMDTFAALALSTEPPLASVIKGMPINEDASVLSNTVWRQIFGITAWNTIIMLVLMIFGRTLIGLDYPLECPTGRSKPSEGADNYDVELKAYKESQAKLLHLTYIFNTFVFLQIFNEINCRKVGRRDFNVFEKFTHNYFFLFIICGTFTWQIVMTNYFSGIVGTVPLDRSGFGACICVGFTPLLVSFFLKLTPQKWVEAIPTSKMIDENRQCTAAVLRAYKKGGIPQRQPGEPGAERIEPMDEDDNENDFQNI